MIPVHMGVLLDNGEEILIYNDYYTIRILNKDSKEPFQVQQWKIKEGQIKPIEVKETG